MYCPRLTPAEARVARCVGLGMDYDAIGARTCTTARTARVHVINIAAKLPNPDGLKPYTLVLLWAAHQRWLEESSRKESAA